MNIEIKDKQLPVVTTNFEEVKGFLKENLAKYKDLVVTEESLPVDKKTKKEMTALRKEIDDKRKEIKKELLAPIEGMEDQFKELISIVDDVLKPLKEGLDVFDEQKRQANLDFANEIINEYVVSDELITSEFIIPANFTNLTMTKKGIKEEIDRQASVMLEKKQQLNKNIEALKKHISDLNDVTELETPITFEEYEDRITEDNIMQLSNEIFTEAQRRKGIQEQIKEALIQKEEVKKSQEETIEEVDTTKATSWFPDAIVEDEVKEEKIEEVNHATHEKRLTYKLQITETVDKLKLLRAFLDANDIKYIKL